MSEHKKSFLPFIIMFSVLVVGGGIFIFALSGSAGDASDEAQEVEVAEPVEEEQIPEEPEVKDAANEEAASYTPLDEEGAVAIIEKNKDNENFHILDIRTKEEFDGGHIENSINIDFYKQTFPEKIDELERDKTYLVYCNTNNRSGETMKLMMGLGFTDIYQLESGYQGWLAKEMPLVVN